MASSRAIWIWFFVSVCLLHSALSMPLYDDEEDEDSINDIDSEEKIPIEEEELLVKNKEPEMFDNDEDSKFNADEEDATPEDIDDFRGNDYDKSDEEEEFEREPEEYDDISKEDEERLGKDIDDIYLEGVKPIGDIDQIESEKPQFFWSKMYNRVKDFLKGIGK